MGGPSLHVQAKKHRRSVELSIFGNRRNYPSLQIMARRASRHVFDVSALQLHHGVLADRRCQ